MTEKLPNLDISYLLENFQNSKMWKEDTHFHNDDNIKMLVHKLGHGFRTWGFLYVTGHKIPQDVIENAFKESREFFEKPMEFKLKYKRDSGISEGFVPREGEIFDPEKRNDNKEVIDFCPSTEFSERLSRELPRCVNALEQLFDQCKDIVNKIFRLLAIELNIDTEYYVNLHSGIGNRKINGTSLRTLYYPPILPNKSTSSLPEVKRCGEHTDYGTITLLFQDDVGGLEVKSPSGQFVKVVPIPGTIVINAGDLFHAWSNGKILATTHRVTVPNDPSRLGQRRQSIAFFSHPNYDVNIDYTDAKGNAHQRNAQEHLRKRFGETIVQ